MKYTTIPGSDKKVSALGLGTMRFSPEIAVNKDGSKNYEKSQETVDAVLSAAIEEQGMTLVDTSDIYGRGRSEEMIGAFLAAKPHLRDQIFLETKCGMHDAEDGKWFDLSKEHILEAANASLKRLKTDYLDCLMLHRPDQLFVPEEVAEVFDELYTAGKVRTFGVSNFSSMQIELLRRAMRQPISVCQMQLSIVHALLIEQRLFVNKQNDLAIQRDNDVLDYCRLHGIRMEAWSVLQGDHPWGYRSFVGDPEYAKLNEVMDRLAEKYDVGKHAIACAWIMRHPAGIIPMVGTTNPKHLAETLKCTEFEITRPEWYELFLSVGNRYL